MHCVAIGLNADIHWLKSKLHDSSYAATEWHRPHTPARRGRVPVGGEDRLRGEVPALFEVVVDEVLQQHLIDVRAAATTGDRPYIVDQYAKHKMAWHSQSYEVRSDGKLPLSRVLAGRSRQLKDGARAPNQLVRFARREQEGGLHIAKAGNANLRPKRLVNDGGDPANDQIPVLAKLQWNHRLDVHYILCTVSGINTRVAVILHGNADEAGHGVLRRFSQCVGIGSCGWRFLRGNLSSLRCNGSILCNQPHR